MHKRLVRIAKPTVVIPLVLVVLLGGAVAWFYKYNQTEAVGTIQQPQAAEPQTKSVATTQFKSATISFAYPAQYALENKTATAPIAEQYSLNTTNPEESRRISVTVRKPLPGESVFDDSAYKFRALKTSDYHISDSIIAGQGAKKTAKKDTSEITYFIPGSHVYVIFAATSTNPRQPFAEEIDAIIKSFAWVR